MYGLLITDPNLQYPNMSLAWMSLLPEDTPLAHPVPAYEKAIDAILQAHISAHQPPITPPERNRIRAALVELARWIVGFTDAQVDFALRVALQHHLLPQAERNQRESRIAGVVEHWFGPRTGWTPSQLTALNGVIATAILVPDALLDNQVRTVCAKKAAHWHQARFDTKPSTLTPAEAADWGRLMNVANKLGHPDGFDSLKFFYNHAPLHQRRERVECLERISNKAEARKYILQYLREADLQSNAAPTAALFDAFWDALRSLDDQIQMAADADPGDWLKTTFATVSLARMLVRQSAAEQHAQAITTQALRNGVDLGTLGRESLQNLTDLQVQQTALSIDQEPESSSTAIPPSPRERPITLTLEAPARQPDPNTARTWRTKRTLEACRGPVARRRNTGITAIDPKTATAALQKRTNEAGSARRSTRQAKAKPKWTEKEASRVLRQSFERAVEFQVAEIKDLLDMTTRFGPPADRVTACLKASERMTTVIHATTWDEVAVRDALAQAEEAIAALRAALAHAQAEARLQARFDHCLTLALSKEVLVHGKERGGVIQQRLTPADWAWVQARYHRRWLSHVTRYETEDGVTTTLPEDCALALYVTASSLSGYAFDISVHLWYRQEGCTGAPSLEAGDYPPMDEAQWYDTYITCAVLHIPSST